MMIAKRYFISGWVKMINRIGRKWPILVIYQSHLHHQFGPVNDVRSAGGGQSFFSYFWSVCFVFCVVQFDWFKKEIISAKTNKPPFTRRDYYWLVRVRFTVFYCYYHLCRFEFQHPGLPKLSACVCVFSFETTNYFFSFTSTWHTHTHTYGQDFYKYTCRSILAGEKRQVWHTAQSVMEVVSDEGKTMSMSLSNTMTLDNCS